MYQPAFFQENDPEKLAALAREIQFACLVTADSGALHTVHAPCVVKGTPGDLSVEFHVAKANPHWRLPPDAPTVAIFQGDQTYIHPGWYPTKAETGKAVPTWTYVTVHMHGQLEVIDNRDDLARHLDELTAFNEETRDEPWSVADAPESYTNRMMAGIVGLRLRVQRIEGALKLNQHKNAADQLGVIAGLRGSGPAATRVADRMAAARQETGDLE
ncbi:FMN-binding negative transcriptional regulator [Oricola cellulosilytica]|uniref:FMN-binding negative transcriptional regulator n=1 Tax=Oricola cellulosilytica TaxID=1429082 RepID=A0A4V2MP66_9HYPH|nr:FMN-binding negative transcriptional regulator [Oricola cellulosilytica]TCD16532.1 FMN-binding negative transcriptional regulator [Oricola cellulosilytica]